MINPLLLVPFLCALLGLVLRSEEDPDADDSQPQDDAEESERPEDVYNIEPPEDEEISDGGEQEASGDDTSAGDDQADESADDLSGFDEALVTQAREMGFVDSEIRDFGSDAALQRTLGLLRGRAESASDTAGDDTAGDLLGGAGQGEKEGPGPEGELEDFVPFEVGLSEETYDPELVKVVKGLSDHNGSQIQRLTQQVGALANELRMRDAVSFEHWFDSELETLPDDFKSIVGEGPGVELGKDSQEYKNRIKVVDQMNTIDRGREASGLPELPQREVFRQAIRAVFGDKQVEFAKSEVRRQARRRKGQIVSRPTARHGKNITSARDRAIDYAERRSAELGIPAGAEPDEEF